VKKKKSGGGGANWMDTYGDMVTLLLCFFVLLYSMSTISTENWKALVMSFNPDAEEALKDIPDSDGGFSSDPNDDSGDGVNEMMGTTQEEIDEDIEELYQALQAMAAQQGAEDSISVTKDGGKVYVTFNDTTFFNGNSYQLRDEALPVLDTLSAILSNASESIDEVRIQGHTAQARADQPNRVMEDRFISSNRATNVLCYVQEHSVLNPGKLVSEGMGQWRPVDTNDTAEGQAHNRRVEVIISGRNLEEEGLTGTVEQYITQPEAAQPDTTQSTTE
jgi:chemotaxis protein MotB